jgi:hypothetical protein
MKTETIGNEKISIALKNAVIEKISLNGKVWNGYPGDFTFIDELDGRIFKSRDAEFEIIENSDNKIVFEKSFTGAEFSVRENWTAFDDCVSWKIELFLKKGCRERTVQIKQLIPYPYPAYRLKVWSANERFPCPLQQLGGLHLGYGDACYGTVIPAVSLYNKDCGITLAKPFDLKTAKLAFNFNDYHSAGLEIISANLALRDKSPAVAEILIRPHEGCWRPGLAWLYEKYTEYFDPPNLDIHKLDGGFMITNPFTEASFVESVNKYKVKWAEVHNHFPYYGNYTPDEKEWESIIKHDYPDLPPPRKLSRSCINEHIKVLQKNNIKAFIYFQCTGDAYIPYAQEHFTDSIAKDPAGKIIPTWKECCFVNALPGTSFNKHIHEQIDKLISDYPDIDGVFLDQICYQTIDAAHDDGVSSCNNQAAAMFGYSYRETLSKLAAILHDRGKFIWGNGPFDIEVQREIDGIMAEGISELAETYKYLCLTKPLLIHTYPDTPAHVKTMFKRCLLAGASYSLGASSKEPVPPPVSPECAELFARYIPLLEKLFGRTWLLEPDPLEIPDGFRANIFRGRDGRSVIIPLVRTDCLQAPENKKAVELRIKIKDLDSMSEAALLTPSNPNPQPLEISKSGDAISVSIKQLTEAALIIIQ